MYVWTDICKGVGGGGRLEERGIVDSDLVEIGAGLVEDRRNQNGLVLVCGQDCLVNQVYVGVCVRIVV